MQKDANEFNKMETSNRAKYQTEFKYRNTFIIEKSFRISGLNDMRLLNVRNKIKRNLRLTIQPKIIKSLDELIH